MNFKEEWKEFIHLESSLHLTNLNWNLGKASLLHSNLAAIKMSKINGNLPKKINIGYWNVETVEGKIREIIKTMKNKDCDILVCVDAKRPDDGEGFLDDVLRNGKGWGRWVPDGAGDQNQSQGQAYDMFWVGQKKPAKALTPGGVCVIFKPGLKNYVIFPDTQPCEQTSNTDFSVETLANKLGDLDVDDSVKYLTLEEKVGIRVLPVVMKTIGGHLKLICCYVPTSSRVNDQLAGLVFEEICKEVETRESLVIIAGDINARFGKADVQKHAEKVGWGAKTNEYHIETNNRGKTFEELCSENNLIISSLLFNSHLRTWQQRSDTDECQKSDLDHFAIGKMGVEVSQSQKLVRRKIGVCHDVIVSDDRLVHYRFHRLCIASLNLENPHGAQ